MQCSLFAAHVPRPLQKMAHRHSGSSAGSVPLYGLMRRSKTTCCTPQKASASSSSDQDDQAMKDEARLEALERGVRRKQGAKAVSAQSEQMRRREEARKLMLGGGMAEWKEGKLLPEGWDGMPLSQKVTELYTGNRGLLFWMGKVTYALIFVLIGGWIVFRFVLPGLGILELQNGLDSPPNL